MLRARVQNGRLIMDEPTELPEGQVVEFLSADEVLDDMNSEERAELPRELEASLAEEESGAAAISAANLPAQLQAAR